MIFSEITNLIIKSAIETKYVKDYVTYLLMIFITIIIRTHIDSLISYLITNIYINTIISIILYFCTNIIFNLLTGYKKSIFNFVNYIINNYDYGLHIKIKRAITFIVCAYCYILSYLIEIDNNIIRMIISRYIIYYVIIDFIENKYYKKIINVFIKSQNTNIYTYDNTFLIKNNKDNDNKDNSNNINEDNRDNKDNMDNMDNMDNRDNRDNKDNRDNRDNTSINTDNMDIDNKKKEIIYNNQFIIRKKIKKE